MLAIYPEAQEEDDTALVTLDPISWNVGSSLKKNEPSFTVSRDIDRTNVHVTLTMIEEKEFAA